MHDDASLVIDDGVAAGEGVGFGFAVDNGECLVDESGHHPRLQHQRNSDDVEEAAVNPVVEGSCMSVQVVDEQYD